MDREEEKARLLFEDLAAELRQHRDESPWLFGAEVGPTVLDAHAVAFANRVMEGRERLVPEDLQAYARRITALPPYQEVTYGRPTKWNASYGRPHELEKW